MAKSVFALPWVNLRSITYRANQNAFGHFAVHMLQCEPKMPLVKLRSISYSADQILRANVNFAALTLVISKKKI